MTILILSVTRTEGRISQDSKGYEPNGRAIGNLQKVACIPGRLITGAAAADAMACAYFMTEAIQMWDIDQLAQRLPEAFHGWPAKVQRTKFIAMFCGWSETSKRVVGYRVNMEKEMVPTLLLNGHHFVPTADPKISGYDDMLPLSDAAEEGQGVPEFHAALAGHFMSVDRAGRYPVSGRMGGILQTATITRDGVSIADNCDLDTPPKVESAAA